MGWNSGGFDKTFFEGSGLLETNFLTDGDSRFDCIIMLIRNLRIAKSVNIGASEEKISLPK